jgi:hypothetical protein
MLSLASAAKFVPRSRAEWSNARCLSQDISDFYGHNVSGCWSLSGGRGFGSNFKDVARLDSVSGWASEKTVVTEVLLEAMLELAKAQVESRQIRSAESTLQTALTRCPLAKDPPGQRANVFLYLGICKKAEFNVSGAERAFSDGLACFAREPDGRLVNKACCGLAAALVQELVILQLENHKLESAGKSVSVLIKSVYHHTSVEKLVITDEPGPPLIYGVASALSAVQLRGPADQIAVLRIYDQLAEYLLGDEPEETLSQGGAKKIMASMVALMEQIAPDTPNFRPLAEKTCRLRARYDDLRKNSAGALKYRKQADSFKK